MAGMNAMIGGFGGVLQEALQKIAVRKGIGKEREKKGFMLIDIK